MRNLPALIIVGTALCGCVSCEHEEPRYVLYVGENWHYAIRHNTGSSLEDENGCPCKNLFLLSFEGEAKPKSEAAK